MKNECSAATLNLDPTGDGRKDNVEATTGIGIYKENGSDKTHHVERSLKVTDK